MSRFIRDETLGWRRPASARRVCAGVAPCDDAPLVCVRGRKTDRRPSPPPSVTGQRVYLAAGADMVESHGHPLDPFTALIG